MGKNQKKILPTSPGGNRHTIKRLAHIAYAKADHPEDFESFFLAFKKERKKIQQSERIARRPKPAKAAPEIQTRNKPSQIATKKEIRKERNKRYYAKKKVKEEKDRVYNLKCKKLQAKWYESMKPFRRTALPDNYRGPTSTEIQALIDNPPRKRGLKYRPKNTKPLYKRLKRKRADRRDCYTQLMGEHPDPEEYACLYLKKGKKFDDYALTINKLTEQKRTAKWTGSLASLAVAQGVISRRCTPDELGRKR